MPSASGPRLDLARPLRASGRVAARGRGCPVGGWRARELDGRGHAAVALPDGHHHATVLRVRIGQCRGHGVDGRTGHAGAHEAIGQRLARISVKLLLEQGLERDNGQCS